jgi:hypothetical protein
MNLVIAVAAIIPALAVMIGGWQGWLRWRANARSDVRRILTGVRPKLRGRIDPLIDTSIECDQLDGLLRRVHDRRLRSTLKALRDELFATQGLRPGLVPFIATGGYKSKFLNSEREPYEEAASRALALVEIGLVRVDRLEHWVVAA